MDTAPVITPIVAHVVKLADLVVIQTQLSHDLPTAGATIDKVQKTGKAMAFVINGSIARARITSDAAISTI